MSDSSLPTSMEGADARGLDGFLREAVPEIKLALGELIDRENARVLPGRYARLLPESLLVVTLHANAAETLAPVALAVERELTDSCMRHGSLYDRAYRVQLRRSADPDAPVFAVSAHAGHTGGPGIAPEADVPAPAPHAHLPAVEADRRPRPDAASELPLADPDATRLGGAAGLPGWQPGRWLLLVEDDRGEQKEAFRLTEPFTTVGRRSDDPQLRTTVALSEVPQVSRRQLALLWEERDGAPGFRVANLGLNTVHLPGRDLAGARVGRGAIDMDSLAPDHEGWLPPGVPLRIGEQGPILRIEEVPEEEPDEDEDVPDDPDATRFG